MRRFGLVLILVPAVAAPAATAQTPTGPTATTPAAKPAPAPPPPAARAVAARISLTPQKLLRSGHHRIALRGRSFRIAGTIAPYVKGEQVVVRLYRGSRKLRAVRVTPKPTSGGRRGVFRVDYRSHRAATITAQASHAATEAMDTARAKPVRVRVVSTRMSFGSRSAAVRLLQSRLAARGYLVGRSGSYDSATGRAVLTFRKVTGMKRTSAGGATVLSRLLAGRGRYKLKFPGHGRHVETDLSRQVIVLAHGGRVYRIIPTSSGKRSTPTVLGHFRVYRKQPGLNSHGMLHSSYFIRGYAIHGYKSVPTYPASHGCLRIPPANARFVFNWLHFGNRVDVYR